MHDEKMDENGDCKVTKKSSCGKRLSYGRQCAAFGCFNRSYAFEDGKRVPTGIRFFKFPEEPSEKTMWCNKIKRQDGKDGFRVNESTRVCEKHFESFKIYRPPGGTRWRLIDGARPLLHEWNSFSLGRNKRKSPTKRHEGTISESRATPKTIRCSSYRLRKIRARQPTCK